MWVWVWHGPRAGCGEGEGLDGPRVRVQRGRAAYFCACAVRVHVCEGGDVPAVLVHVPHLGQPSRRSSRRASREGEPADEPAEQMGEQTGQKVASSGSQHSVSTTADGEHAWRGKQASKRVQHTQQAATPGGGQHTSAGACGEHALSAWSARGQPGDRRTVSPRPARSSAHCQQQAGKRAPRSTGSAWSAVSARGPGCVPSVAP